MKKLLVLFVAVAATFSSFAATTMYYFNRAQFQWSSQKAKEERDSITSVNDGGKYQGQEDFNWQVTVPMVYQGTIALKTDWILEPIGDDNALPALTYTQRKAASCLITPKATYPAVMTLCQPCIDCYPCETLNTEDHAADGKPHPGIFAASANGWTGITDQKSVIGYPGFVTIWNLYIVTRVNKADKQVEVFKIDLIDSQTDPKNVTYFFTGSHKGNAYVKSQPVDPNLGQVNLQLTGAKNDYKFKYYTKFLASDGTTFEWHALPYYGGKDFPKGYYTADEYPGDEEISVGTKQTAYIKSAKSLNGTIYYNKLVGGQTAGEEWKTRLEVLDAVGTVKLTRNASLTGAAVKATFGVVVTKNNAKNWDDCQEADPQCSTCEQYFYEGFEDAYFGSKYKNYEVVNIADPVNYNGIYNSTSISESKRKESNVTDYQATLKAASFGSFFGLFYNPKYEESFKKFYESPKQQ